MALPHRYVFVAGLHRSGTSLVARILGNHPQIASIENAPVPENEGCYLQGGIPHTALHGIPGEFATDPVQHLVEGCAFDTLETQQRIEHDWSNWFDSAKPWRVEKSPVNLTRMRLYQNLFPTAQFIVVKRNPLKLAAAMAKWSQQSTEALIRYALDAYALADDDLRYLHAAMVVHYEELVEHPQQVAKALYAFLGLDCVELAEPIHDGNADYADHAIGDRGLRERLLAAGYDPDGSLQRSGITCRHPLRAVREAVESAFSASPD
ncbi:sulfotransferase family protein [Aurantiacibacter gangjinensis]|uniref:Nodulation protein NoeE n=1 Tax=Aurantiacibacter gangjinensis TaxID=502682 RepID=A0A0G9MK11_9SPHN|nr:sulfotransferase [Aurantiacibacter gangjinensis]APE29413.1 hypothetical protein BMF35_b0158 [Aurantiacibacter gangjinensis]KLE31025.1 nodulation protein NoeE [Aurantiacibacter gangjinensis]